MNEIKKHIAECGEAVTPPAVINARHTLLFLLPKFMQVTTKRKVYKNLTKEQISLILEICQNPQIAKEIDNCYGTLANFWECDNIKVKNSIEVSRTANYMRGCLELLYNAVNSL